MNVLYLSITPLFDLDERGIYTDLLRTFLSNGHSLTIYSPKSGVMKTKEYANVSFRPIKVGSLTKVNPIKKVMNYFIFSRKLVWALKSDTMSYDLVLYSTPPIQLIGPLRRIKKRSNALFYLMLKDIFPQNAIDLTMLKTRGVLAFLTRHYRKMEFDLYDLSDRIGVMSKANQTYLLNQHPNLRNKAELLPNAIDLSVSPKITSDRITIRKRYELPENAVISVFGGNIGKPQGIDFIEKVISAHETLDDSILLFVGNGTEYKRLINYIQSVGARKAIFLSQLSKSEFDELLFHCDIGLLFLDYRFTIPNFPSRILSYFEFSKPVLAATDKSTDIRDILEQNEAGLWVPSNDPDAFIKKLKSLVEHSNIRKRIGDNARLYLEQHWTIDKAYKTIMMHLSEGL
jgi:glycosyltransferase involved in cell wall biosynthesis